MHFVRRLSEPAYAAMRIVFAFEFALHGVQKLTGDIGGRRVPLDTLLGAAGTIESIGGLLIGIGLFTSLVAFLCAGEMAFVYFIRHAPQGGLPIQNQGELAVLFCFAFLYIATRGGGFFSVDRLRGVKT